MRPETRLAIEQVFKIEQDSASERWGVVLQKGLFGGSPSWSNQDNRALHNGADALLAHIMDKAAKITERTRIVFDSYKDFPTENEQRELETELERILRADIDHASLLLSTVKQFEPAQVTQPRAFLQNKGERDRRAALHDFEMMLVSKRTSHIDVKGPAIISVVRSKNIQIGQHNVSSTDKSNRTTIAFPATQGEKRPWDAVRGWLATTIGALIVALLAGYLIWRFGWNR
jgi:hypothetical protein